MPLPVHISTTQRFTLLIFDYAFFFRAIIALFFMPSCAALRTIITMLLFIGAITFRYCRCLIYHDIVITERILTSVFF